jgi:hypothetical protein
VATPGPPLPAAVLGRSSHPPGPQGAGKRNAKRGGPKAAPLAFQAIDPAKGQTE